MDNPKAVLRDTLKRGKGIFANKKILKGEIIAEFDGRVYRYDYKHWTDKIADHVIQFEEKKWKESNGIAKFINHSCEPNCGVKDLFKIVAMRDIKAGEEVTWDYEMTERHKKWKMKCRCGSPICRKIIGNYDNMPEEIRKKYRGYISEWLLKKEDKKNRK